MRCVVGFYFDRERPHLDEPDAAPPLGLRPLHQESEPVGVVVPPLLDADGSAVELEGGGHGCLVHTQPTVNRLVATTTTQPGSVPETTPKQLLRR